MSLVSVEEMRGLEEAAFAAGSTAEGLMELAGAGMFREIVRRFPKPGRVVVYAGKGHNGGDALVVGRLLKEAGWEVKLREVFPAGELAELTRWKREEAGLGKVSGEFPEVVLDGLLGIGAKGELREPLGGAAAEINALRERGAFVVAMDVPSGLDVDSGEPAENGVRADLTLTVGAVKRGLVADGATDFVGSLVRVPVEGLEGTEGGEVLSGPENLAGWVPRRAYNFHKGKAGRMTIVAGSRGYFGAAVLVALGALHGGAGLVTVVGRERDYGDFLPLLPPEVMLRPVADYGEAGELRADAWVVGPGLEGLTDEEEGAVLELIGGTEKPMVVDAGALNLLAERERIGVLGERHVLTPHPGEMERLFAESVDLSRAETARRFCEKWPVTLLLKGSRTVVTRGGEGLFYNGTGTPGMGTGGMGDFLSGLIGALLARGVPELHAARAGAWLAGRASEIALENGRSEETLVPSYLTHTLGEAFREMRRGK